MLVKYNENIMNSMAQGDIKSALTACSELLLYMEKENLKGTIPYAASLVTVASACKMGGMIKEACDYYVEALSIYDKELPPMTPPFVSLYTGLAATFSEMKDYDSANEIYEKALAIQESNDSNEIDTALIHIDFASSLLKHNEYGDALEHLSKANINFEKTANENYSETQRQTLIEILIILEWEAFDKARNEGGRACCQDDGATFYLMRKSQYLTWTKEMLESFINDFVEANKRGWNLIAEKYGRMEENTAPDKWVEIKDCFPTISEEKKSIIESIVELQVSMMEDFAKEFPDAAANARSIHSDEDTEYNTSYETYLRGELSTYSDNTLLLYGRFIAEKASKGENLAREIITNTAKLQKFT